jgi:hydrogenase expression/formation protein HypE
MSKQIDLENWVCPLPLREHPNIVMGHGSGGRLSADLVQHLFLPAFQNETLQTLGDSAVLAIGSARLAFSTDSFVVRPLFFPGGNIGHLAVNGTVNDLAMSGAQPLFLSVAFILEEGLSLETLGLIVDSMAAAANQAGVTLVAGDTKVVDRGHGDGIYINTTGLGLIPDGLAIGPHQARPGDVILVSGEIGVHGIAIMSVREGLEFETVIETDSAPLNSLVGTMLQVSHNIHVLRDPTRGGLASTLNEIAVASKVGIRLEEKLIPVPAPVQAACEFLGLDPLYVANEGKLVAIVPADIAGPLLERMQQHPAGTKAAVIGQVTAEHPGLVVAQTGWGSTRVVDMKIGEQLPRIC